MFGLQRKSKVLDIAKMQLHQKLKEMPSNQMKYPTIKQNSQQLMEVPSQVENDPGKWKNVTDN
jgi:hypothetical protein